MQTYQEENDSKILVVLLSILLHLGLLFAFLFINEYDISYKKMLEKLKEQQEQMWAETNPAASNFGAPVIFEDIPNPPPVSASATSPQPPQQAQQESAHNNLEQGVSFVEAEHLQNQPVATAEEIANNDAKEVEDLAQNSAIYQAAQKTLDQVRQHARHTGLTQKTMTTMVSGQSLASAVRGAKRKLDHEMKRLEESMKKLEKYAQQKQRLAKPTSPMMQSHQQPAQPAHQTPPPAMPQKRKLTLADLAKGFLTHLKNEGQDALKMYGKKGAKATQEQLKLQRYVQKIVWQLENSMRIHRGRLKITRELETELYIYLALNRNGTLKELKLSKSSGIREIDNFYMFIFKDASTSFPPVPSYLPGNPLKLNFHAPINTYRQRFSISY